MALIFDPAAGGVHCFDFIVHDALYDYIHILLDCWTILCNQYALHNDPRGLSLQHILVSLIVHVLQKSCIFPPIIGLPYHEHTRLCVCD